MSVIYGYCRVSTGKQKIERQIENIKAYAPEAVIMTESYTGTTIDRPVFKSLLKRLKSGDTLIFDEVSRMSRTAADGVKLYEELAARGVNLVFLKEHHIDTSTFRDTLQIARVGDAIADTYIDATNKVLMLLAKRQIEIAFETAQAEVDMLHKRTSEGVRRAQARGEQIGRLSGSKVETAKAKAAKADIMRLSRSFGGALNDEDLQRITGISRNTLYKYKKELKAEA